MNDSETQLAQHLIAGLHLEDVTPDQLAPEDPLFGNGLGLDSIDALELAVIVERHYGVRITDMEIGKQAFSSLRALDRFITAVRTTIKSLSAKEYWRQFSPAPEFVVMFMPGEAFFSAAVSLDPDLLYNSADSRVILASPTTLMALLMAIRHGWQQQQVAENAERIAEAGRELYDRLCVFAKHIDGVRGGLQKAAEAYNNAVGNWESRTLPSAKKLKELGAADAGSEVAELQSLETQLRVVPTEFRLANGE